MLQAQDELEQSACDAPALPPQVELIISALETGEYRQPTRRVRPRKRYRVQARLRLFSELSRTPSPWVVYTRDINARGLGFISRHRLPLGYGGTLELPHPEGGVLNLSCTLLRCREAAPGWYEGAVYFSREQPELDAVE